MVALVGVQEESQHEKFGLQFADEIRRIAGESQAPVGALKELCGVGTYKKSASYPIVGNLSTTAARTYYVCDHCGHPRVIHLGAEQSAAGVEGEQLAEVLGEAVPAQDLGRGLRRRGAVGRQE